MADEETNPRPSFCAWLADHRGGVADADLADALKAVAHAAAMTGKTGELTLKLKITPQGDMLSIADTLTVKVPQDIVPRLYWIDLKGELTRNNPLQPRLPMGEDRPHTNQENQ